jgi:hypothetical protein
MRAAIAVVVFVMVFGLHGLASAKESEASDANVRSASVLRAKAAELRDKANHLRDGEGVKKPNVAGAKKLEREADALRKRADQLDPQQWPPK